MIEFGIQLVVLAVVLAIMGVIAHNALMPRFHFLVRIHGDAIEIVKGKVGADFLAAVSEVCREQGITSGWIGGVKRGKSVALRFSNNIPPNCQQRLRNIWFTS